MTTGAVPPTKKQRFGEDETGDVAEAPREDAPGGKTAEKEVAPQAEKVQRAAQSCHLNGAVSLTPPLSSFHSQAQ